MIANIKTFLIISLLTVLFLPTSVFAHPGRTDSSGCHTCRTNCPSWGLSTGEYHCHRAKALPQPLEPIKSTKGINGGAGYTAPAPEYKTPTINSINPSQSQPASNVKVSFWGRILSWLGWR